MQESKNHTPLDNEVAMEDTSQYTPRCAKDGNCMDTYTSYNRHDMTRAPARRCRVCARIRIRDAGEE